MDRINRRGFLGLAAGATAMTALSPSIARAAAIPADRRAGTLADVEHIVVLMRENRSFDHYFGSLRGVRGFGDRTPVTKPDGESVWHQDGVLPFHPGIDDLGLACGPGGKSYQDEGDGLDGPGFWGWTSDPYIGNYGDNSLLYFDNYRNAAPGSPLYEKARTGTNLKAGDDLFRILREDVVAASCRRCRGSSRPRRTPSTRTGRRTTAPGTSRTCSTR
jgi:phospholipase C